MGAMHSLFWLFITDIFHQILFYFGGVVGVAIVLVEKKRKRPISWRLVFYFFLFCLFVSCFQAWIDEHHNSELLISKNRISRRKLNFGKARVLQKTALLYREIN